jgi:phosphoesterase RecJ-like protein
MALKDLEILFNGRVALLTVTSEMFEATNTDSMDTDGFVEFPRSIKGVDLAVFIRQSGPRKCKVSLRSKGGTNTAALAHLFGGGGHFHAAGFTVHEEVSKAREMVMDRIEPFLPPVEGGDR